MTPVLKKNLKEGDIVYFPTTPKIVDGTKIRGLENKVEKLTFSHFNHDKTPIFVKETGKVKKFYGPIKDVLFHDVIDAERQRRVIKVSVMNKCRKNIDKELKRLAKLEYDLVCELDKEMSDV